MKQYQFFILISIIFGIGATSTRNTYSILMYLILQITTLCIGCVLGYIEIQDIKKRIKVLKKEMEELDKLLGDYSRKENAN